ncbi:MAG: hypothetical protein JSS84_11765 [Bacteroidetes bacterium]|nr:hypothetical protein [Bacteroidota bacterium]
MSLNEEFDELARQKLAGRNFPYQEGDWQQARALIDAHRGGRKRGAWFVAGGALLLLLGLVWTFMNGPAKPGRQVAEAPTPGAPPPTMAPGAAAAHAPAAARPHPEHRPPADTVVAEAAGGPERPSATRTISSRARPGMTAARAKAGIAGPAQGAAANPFRTPAAGANGRHTGGSTTGGAAQEIHRHNAADTTAARASGTNARGSDAFAQAESRPPEAQPAKAAGTASPGTANTASPWAERPAGPLPAAQTPVPHDLSGTGEHEAGAPASQLDTTAGLSVTQCLPQDSASATPPPAPPPIIPSRAPWEVSLLGGLFSTASRYTGSASATWSADVGRAQGPGFGAELMHAGRNISIGIGMHYGSYAERIRAGAVDAASTSLNQYWYLHPVTTTVLVITDTLPGAPPSYTGHTTTTTVNVLAQGTDTVVTSRRLRDARDLVNRVTYLELPLLVDAHLVQGRWTLGVRGGPSVGLLTGRRGALPNPAGDGYLALNDVAFRELTLGYTARAYVRYRFNAAWSAGVGPALHGQMLNSLAGAGLERRSTAIGALVDLTYRLR